MAKSKLTLQQRRRIEDKRSRSSSTTNKDTLLDTLLASGQLGPERRGTVVTRYSNQADVLPDDLPDVLPTDAPPQSRLRRCHFRAHLSSLVTGDKVVWQDGESHGVICAVLPRKSLLERPDGRGKIRPVVANVDTALIVVAPTPEPYAGLIDRYLVACEYHQITAIIVANKMDMDADHVNSVLDIIEPYRGIGYEVLSVSAESGQAMDALAACLKDKMSVFVGQSGVGKSSLINALCPAASAKIGALSDARAKGRHTTTTADLFMLPGGGSIIDSPGIREFGLGHIDQHILASGFIEFRPFLGQCRFRNCHHLNEPDCALREACTRGEISRIRLDSFLQIRQSLTLQ